MNQDPTLDSHTASLFERQVVAQFEEGGALANATDNFVSRPGQMSFARAVSRAIESRGVAVIEAGTGTGKTFAYMTPALISGCKVIVSTAGKSLQDQLYTKDIPAVKGVLKNNAKVALLKGRSNYLCLHRLDMTIAEGLLKSRSAVDDLATIRIFSQTTKDGDCTTIRGVPEDSSVWPAVTSTKENCLAKRCRYYDNCFVNKARQAAKDADIVVVNHHLFLSAMADDTPEVPEDVRLLPSADVVIFDEAHKLPEIASNFFGSELSTWSIRNVVREMKVVLLAKLKSYQLKSRTWDDLTDTVLHHVDDFVLSVDEAGVLEGDNKNILEVDDLSVAAKRLEGVRSSLKDLLTAVGELTEENEDLAQHTEVAEAIGADLALWVAWLSKGRQLVENEAPVVRWISRGRNDVRLNETPLNIADSFAKMRENHSNSAWIFTSATIATGKADFSHFVNQMGLLEADTYAWSSPFDYPRQAMLYVPQNMPNPKGCDRDEYIRALVRESWPVIDLLAGRTFILCTSYQAMDLAAQELEDYIDTNDRDYTVFVQGQDSRQHLLDKFRTTPNSILIATMSFWEGIDIKGERLSLVIIDKLPFAPQGDPVLSARCKWIEKQGKNPFQTYQIPLAAIALKQGAGRLIRSENDRGILIVGDTRIIPNETRYGKHFLDSLPDYVRTRQLQRVLDFWRYPDKAT